MNAATKANGSLDAATLAVMDAAKKRRLAAFRMKQAGKTCREIGEVFGVSRQRASQMVRQAERDFARDYAR